jgi:peptidoglycan hydrolase CwlO-like protein
MNVLNFSLVPFHIYLCNCPFLLFSPPVEEKKEKTLQNILNAKNKIRYEIGDLKERVKLAKETIVKFKDEITKLQTNTGNMS